MLPTRHAIEIAAAEVGLGAFAAVLEDLESGEIVRAGVDRPFYPASMIKTPLAAAVYWLAHTKQITLDGPVIVTQANMTANDASSPLVPGYAAQYEQLIDLMISRSDNVATNMLFDVAGRSRATQAVRDEFGLTETAFYRKLSGSEPLIEDPEWDGVHRNTHPPEDAAHLFSLIARDRIPCARLLFDMLTRQSWNEKLPAGLSPGDRFAHKTGDTDEVTHDGGILETAHGRYVLVVYTGMQSAPGNNEKFGPFMARLRTMLR